jgi:signal transduction histidine kinase
VRHSSDAILTRLLAEADSGAVSSIARLLDSAAFSVAVFERGEQVRVAYLNAAASAQAAVGGEAAIGRPIAEVFPNVNASLIEQLLGDPAGDEAPVRLRGLLPGGSAWSLDAIRLGPDRVVIFAEELGEAVSSRRRLESLLASMDAIWRPVDVNSMPAQVVEQAARLLPDVDIVLCTTTDGDPGVLRIESSNGEAFAIDPGPVAEDSLAERAAASGEPIEINLPNDTIVVRPDLQPAGARAVRAVPLTLANQPGDGHVVAGVLVLVKRTSAPFTDAERRLVDEYGKLVALALHRAQLLREARDSARRLRLTLDLAMALASSLSAREVVRLLLHRTLDAVNADRATLSSIGAEELVIEATYSREGEFTWVGRRYPVSMIDAQPLIKRAMETRQPVVGGRLDADRAEPEFREARAMIAQTANLPLMLHGEIGGLLVVSRADDQGFSNDDLGILELMGNAAMLALHNARLVEDLKVANAAKTQFLNMAAHELRTPVTVIGGFTTILQAGVLDGAVEKERALDVIQQKTQELAKLVDSLLAAARLETVALGLKAEAFDIVQAVQQAVARAQPFATLSGAKLRLDAPASAVDAVGHPEPAGRILDNLINNAIAYSAGSPHVTVRLAAGADYVDVEVEDGGRGIPDAYHAAVFDEFVRLDDGDVPSPPGAGLGLYIGKRLAESMEGELALVRSAPGEGSLFRLRLRRADAGMART